MEQTEQQLALQHKGYNEKLIITKTPYIHNASLKDIQEWLELRQEKVLELGWRTPEQQQHDDDDYDADPSTAQFIFKNQAGEVTGGMRLTPRESIDQTLSWSMLKDLPESAKTAVEGPVWDLTRLIVSDERIPNPIDRLNACAELFGAGFAHIKQLTGEENPTWVFAVERNFLNSFKRYGIEFTEIEGTEQPNGSLLCYAYPKERTQFLYDHQAEYSYAYTSVMQGIERAGGRWVGDSLGD